MTVVSLTVSFLWRVITAKIICRITSVLGGFFFLATLAHVNFVPNFFFLEGGWGGGWGNDSPRSDHQLILPIPIYRASRFACQR